MCVETLVHPCGFTNLGLGEVAKENEEKARILDVVAVLNKLVKDRGDVDLAERKRKMAKGWCDVAEEAAAVHIHRDFPNRVGHDVGERVNVLWHGRLAGQTLFDQAAEILRVGVGVSLGVVFERELGSRLERAAW